jgi:RHS repeat-associated protein
VEPETGATVQNYDGAGNIVWIAKGLNLLSTSTCDEYAAYASGRRSDRSYTVRNMLDLVTFPDGQGNQDWNYWPDGNPSSVSVYNPNAGWVSTSYGYSPNSRRLLESEQTTIQGTTLDIANHYDANGHRDSQTFPDSTAYPSGYQINFQVNALGQVKGITGQDAVTYASGVRYYANGASSEFYYGNGYRHQMSQNARLLPSWAGDNAVVSLSYTYDKNGNVTGTTDSLGAGRQSRSMTYDGLDRLTGASSSMFGAATYTYDVVDNLRHVQVGGSVNRPARDGWYCYDASWHLTHIDAGGCGGVAQTAFTYDAQGNVASKDSRGYVFDFGNRLRATSGLEWYAYDGLGRRVLSCASVCAWQLYSRGGEAVYSYDYRTGTRSDRIYLNGSLLAIREQPVGGGAVTIKYQHTDALGSPIAVTNSLGQLLETTEYEPYGAQGNRPMVDGVGYTGHAQDSASGLVYMQQRYFDPVVGRFMSVDPLGPDDSSSVGFNRYAYAANNPYRFTDPDGREEDGNDSPEKKRKERKPDEPPPEDPPSPPPPDPSETDPSQKDRPIETLGTVTIVGTRIIQPPALPNLGLGRLVGAVGRSISLPLALLLYTENNCGDSRCGELQMNSEPGFWPGDAGSEEWGRRTNLGAKEGKRRFHKLKQDYGGGATEDFVVNPDTGEVKDGAGDSAGNLDQVDGGKR